MTKKSLTLKQKAEIDSLVKRANQRLRELEKQGHTKEHAYQSTLNQHSRGAKYITTDSKGRVKFRTDVQRAYKENPQIYYSLKQRVSEFLGMKTSKAGEIKKSYNKGAKKIKEKYGISLTPSETKEIFTSQKWHEVMTQYSSETVMDLVALDERDDVRVIEEILEDLHKGKSVYSIEQKYKNGDSVRSF